MKPSQPLVKPPPQPEPKQVEPEPLWHVILIDDDDHTFQYVITMLAEIFHYPPEKGFEMACQVNENGRVVVATVHKELAELRQEQIMTFGPDPEVKNCPGSMRAEIEPAL